MTFTLKVWMRIETYRGRNEYVFCGSINDGATYVFHRTTRKPTEEVIEAVKLSAQQTLRMTREAVRDNLLSFQVNFKADNLTVPKAKEAK